MEQLEYKILFRWFVGLGMDGPVWDPNGAINLREAVDLSGLSRATLQRRTLAQIMAGRRAASG
jgi:hypothetical protein